jgi:hypothetical protein
MSGGRVEGRKIGLLSALSLLCLSRYEDQVLVGFGLGNEEPSEYLEFEHHNSPAPDSLQTNRQGFQPDRRQVQSHPTPHTKVHDRPFLISSPDE